ncbi:hypothetical protein B9S64_25900 [Streptomyces sp. SM18]|nr:hypothetical protein B9S64_25900 [Streptomyces sp. SM18]
MRKYDRRMNTYRTGGVGAVPGVGAEAGGYRVDGGNPAAERDAQAAGPSRGRPSRPTSRRPTGSSGDHR